MIVAPRALALVLSFLLIGPVALAGEKEGHEKAALEAAAAWLSLVDEGRYEESWEQSAELFRGAVTKSAWKTAAAGAREPLGDLKVRRLSSQSYHTELPGAPDGHYVILQFESSFTKKRSATETVTPMRDPDGKWRVSGYYVK